jgi:hypothetical protein
MYDTCSLVCLLSMACVYSRVCMWLFCVAGFRVTTRVHTWQLQCLEGCTICVHFAALCLQCACPAIIYNMCMLMLQCPGDCISPMSCAFRADLLETMVCCCIQRQQGVKCSACSCLLNASKPRIMLQCSRVLVTYCCASAALLRCIR